MKLDLVDVFGSSPLKGNPLGVVHGGEVLDDAAMLALTRWLGFSETTFLLAPSDPGADYRVRIFTPTGELPFAGHPTLGTCHAWLAAGGKPRKQGSFVQQCGIGLVELRRADSLLCFKAPPLTRTGPLTAQERATAIAISGVDERAVIEAVHLGNGPDWQLLRLRSAQDVLAANPAGSDASGAEVGIAGPCGAGAECDWEVRAFVAREGGRLAEDPVTGSLNAGLAMHLFACGIADGSYVAAQGRKTGADGRVHCSIDQQGAVWVGGRVATIASGGELAV